MLLGRARAPRYGGSRAQGGGREGVAVYSEGAGGVIPEAALARVPTHHKIQSVPHSFSPPQKHLTQHLSPMAAPPALAAAAAAAPSRGRGRRGGAGGAAGGRVTLLSAPQLLHRAPQLRALQRRRHLPPARCRGQRARGEGRALVMQRIYALQ
jgi:hypothetical protein